ncbi:MAG: hypothetical protein K6G01_00790 [Eubacterium sp.]|nr:hypothetical protein [Eubacterium sp.]
MTIDSIGMGYSNYQFHTEQQAKEAGVSNGEIKNLKRVGNIECATCASRKYQDGSDEMVSFKAAAHIDPSAAAARVSAHEQEHVSNAYKDAAQNNGKVINASVQLHTSICPECGRTYVSGGTTTTQIMYKDDEYSQNAKSRDAAGLVGGNIDLVC